VFKAKAFTLYATHQWPRQKLAVGKQTIFQSMAAKAASEKLEKILMANGSTSRSSLANTFQQH